MPTFEEMGRTIDRELDRLREVADRKVKPATRRKVSRVLRSVSASLSRLAAQIESKGKKKKL
jgi:hypothetical protein